MILRVPGRLARDRVGWTRSPHLAAKKAVPIHRHTIWYYLGGMTLFLFVVQVGTGILLLLYYRPSADEAYESVQFIMTDVPFGWLIRSIHSWSANLMIGAAFVHMFSVFFLKAYRPPREVTWLSGAAAALPRARLRVHRLPAAVERARLLRHQGRHRHHRRDAGGSGPSVALPARRHRTSPAPR